MGCDVALGGVAVVGTGRRVGLLILVCKYLALGAVVVLGSILIFVLLLFTLGLL